MRKRGRRPANQILTRSQSDEDLEHTSLGRPPLIQHNSYASSRGVRDVGLGDTFGTANQVDDHTFPEPVHNRHDSSSFHLGFDHESATSNPNESIGTSSPNRNRYTAASVPRKSKDDTNHSNCAGGVSAGYNTSHQREGQTKKQRTSHRNCRYPALEPITAFLNGVIELGLACEFLDVYFTEPSGTWLHSSSPYVLDSVIRKQAVTRTENTRPMSAALVVTILWTVSQTVTSSALLRPGRRTELTSRLQDLAFSLYHDRDIDHWHRFEGTFVTLLVGILGIPRS